MAIGLGIRIPFILQQPNQLLDNFPLSDVSSAFSIRSLYAASTSAKNWRIRETGGNTEQDFSFSGGVMDQAAIESFVGVNDGRIVEWFNQRDNIAIANSTASEQPKIASGGSYLGEVTYTVGTNEALEAPDATLTVMDSEYTLFMVLEVPVVPGAGLFGIMGQQFGPSPTYTQNAGGSAFVHNVAKFTYAQVAPTVLLNFTNNYPVAQDMLITITFDTLKAVECFMDQVSEVTGTFAAHPPTGSVFRIGAQRLTNTVKDFNIKEFISFTRELTPAEILEVETDIKAFYGI